MGFTVCHQRSAQLPDHRCWPRILTTSLGKSVQGIPLKSPSLKIKNKGFRAKVESLTLHFPGRVSASDRRVFCLQTVIKEDLPRRAKTLSSDSEELLNEAKMTQKRLQQGIERGRWQGHSGALINPWAYGLMQK